MPLTGSLTPNHSPLWPRLSVFSAVPQPVVQQQEGHTIQLADAGEPPEFPEYRVEGSSQLLLSAAFLTAEIALLQKSFDLNMQDTTVSCPVPRPLDGSPCLACLLELSWGCGQL